MTNHSGLHRAIPGDGGPMCGRMVPEKCKEGRKLAASWEKLVPICLLDRGDVIVCTPTQVCCSFALHLSLPLINSFWWDVLLRHWRQQKNVQNIGLLIADGIQLVGEVGPTYKVVTLWTWYVSAQTEIKTHIVACGVSLANACDLDGWMGAPSHAIFNFSPRWVFSWISHDPILTGVV